MTTSTPERRLDGFDVGLLILFLIGLYTHYTIQITDTVPFPAAPAGIAGIVLLWRRRNDISVSAFSALTVVILLYLLSILSASDLTFLGRRFNGLIQLTYSLVIGFAAFLTVTNGDRDQISKLFLGFSLVILIGCLLEQYGGLKPISDAVRERIYSSGVYDADVRDEILYGRIRPKFFASEPSVVTLCYTLFTFVWMVTSRWRLKLLGYLALIGFGVLAMPGPTLLLMLLLLVPYELSNAVRRGGNRGIDVAQLVKISVITLFLAGSFAMLASSLFARRIQDISEGADPSFFYRVLGPMLAAHKVIEHYPIAGGGLTGEPFVENDVVNAFIESPAFSRGWTIAHPATELLINYFWLHWIYLGLVWGTIMIVALSFWLRALGVQSVAFCWIVWAILGQASGAYVGPMTWAIFFLAAAASVVASRVEAPAVTIVPAHSARLPPVTWRAVPRNVSR